MLEVHIDEGASTFDPATRSVLLDLAKKRDVPSLIHCLDVLTKEVVDADHRNVTTHTLASLASLANDRWTAQEHELQERLGALAEYVGVDAYVEAACEPKLSAGYLDLVLGATDPTALAAEGAASLLAPVLDHGDLGKRVALWLTRIPASAEARADFLRPFLRYYGEAVSAEESDETLLERGAELAVQSDMLPLLRDEVLTSRANDLAATVGALYLLSQIQDEAVVQIIGPYLEDASAWTHVSRAVFTPERLDGLAGHLSEGAISAILSAARDGTESSRTEITRQLAIDPDFHRSMGGLLGSRKTYLSLGRLLTDAKVGAALKHLVSDTDVPVREAAASALATIGTPDVAPYLQSGLVDRNKRVRQVSQAALLAQLGEDEYQALLDGMQAEVGIVRERLTGMADWARNSLARIEDIFARALGASQQGASWLSGTARRWLGR